MADNPVSIIVDTRERNGRVVKYWDIMPGVFPGLQLEFRELDQGDYVLGNSIVVERKSSTAFMLSVMDKHVFGAVAKLKAEFERVIYIVEGDIYAPRFHSNPEALRGALAYMSAVEGVAVIPSSSAEDTAQLIYPMALEAQHPERRALPLRSDKPRDLASSRQYLIEGLPGVSGERAKILLKYFGSVARVFSASDEELQNAGGLSAEAVARIRTVLEN